MRLLLVLLTIIACTKAQTTINYRLPTNIIPSRYVIELIINFDETSKAPVSTFQGTARITLTSTVADIREIKLNTKNLTLLNVQLQQGTNAAVNTTSISDEDASEIRTLTFLNPLTINVVYVLTITYTGTINDDMTGLYKSSYIENEDTM